MAKSVLISIRPEWVEKIARGEKTVEVRKTRPKLDTPFKCYIYCTQGNDARRLRGSWGKVIGEFICDRVETIKAETEPYGIYDSADAVPVRHGAWYPRFEDWRQQQEGNKCSVCGFEYYGTGIRSFHYCPNCGAKMDLI